MMMLHAHAHSPQHHYHHHHPPPAIPHLPNLTSKSSISPSSSSSSAAAAAASPALATLPPVAHKRTSSLRDPLPDATPPGGSRSSSVSSDIGGDDFLAHQTKGAARRRRQADGDEAEYEHSSHLSPNHRGDKRRRVASNSSRHADSAALSPSNGNSQSPDQPPTGRRMHTLAPIKPMGFAASRESRRDEGDIAIPSPVVMGFDFKQVDGDQLRTVRDTISIREQQQALIAQRRKDVVASTPATPKELTFKGWQPKDPERLNSGGGVGKRREKTREKVEGLTINTGVQDREQVLSSKVDCISGKHLYVADLQSAPLGQGLQTQQQSPRDPMSGSHAGHHILPPLPGYPHMDLRTAPLSHARTRNGDDRDLRDPREAEYPRGQFWRPLPRPTGYENIPHTARPTISIPSDHRRNFTTSSLHPSLGPRDRRLSGHTNGQHSQTPSPPHGVSREPFPQPPAGAIYDLMHQTDQLRFSLQDLLHRYEGAYAGQVNAMADFKNTAAQAGTLLGTLQASADSLKDMVRYEVNRAGSAERREVDELKERLKKLEDMLAARPVAAAATTGDDKAEWRAD